MGDTTLDLVEEEIRRAEELLARDLMSEEVSGKKGPGSSTTSYAWGNRQAPSEPRIPVDRRREIIAQLQSEREQTKSGGTVPQRRGPGGARSGVSGSGSRSRPAMVARSHAEAASVSNLPHKSADIWKQGAPATESKSSNVSASNRFKSVEARDALIQKLLDERSATKRPKGSPASTRGGDRGVEPAIQSSGNDIAVGGLAGHLMSAGDGPVDISAFISADSGDDDDVVGGGAGAPAPAVENQWQTQASAPTEYTGKDVQTRRLSPNRETKQQSKRVPSPAVKRAPAPRVVPKPQAKPALQPKSQRAKSVPRPRPFSRRTKADVRREVEVEHQKQCTFKPRINKWKNEGGRALESRGDRMLRLAAPRAELFASREKMREEQKEKREMEECTFKPNITQRRAGAGPGPGPGNPASHVPLEERLHHEADQRAMERERAKRHLEEAEMESFPFKPSINPHTAAILDMTRYRPIHERVGDLQRAKNAELQRRRIEAEQGNPNLTFKPEISAESERLVHLRRLESRDASAFDVTERLVKDAASGAEKRMRRQEAWEEKKAEEYRFHPELTEGTKRIIEESGEYHESFLDRQAVMNEKKKAKEEAVARRKMKEDEEKYKFKPDIGNTNEILSHSNPHRMQESAMERVQRLSSADRERISKLREGVSEKYHKQFTYKPELNKISQNLGRAMTVDELVENEKNKRVKRAAQAVVERDLKAACTFKPDITTNASAASLAMQAGMESRFKVNMKNPEEIMSRIDDYRADRATKLQQTRQAMEYEKLRECTFTPEIARRRPKPAAGPVVVRGLGRYLELKELAKRLENEKQEREEKAFSTKDGSRLRARGCTIPQPFQLHKDPNAQRRREALERQHRNAEMNECTFRPHTTEGRNRVLIEKILSESE